MNALSPELIAHLTSSPAWSGSGASGCGVWIRWLQDFASIGDHPTLTRAAVAAARLLLPYYEHSFRGDARPRLAIEAAEALLLGPTSVEVETAKQILARVSRIQVRSNAAGSAGGAAAWTLRTALAQAVVPPQHWLANVPLLQPQGDWRYCAFMALTLTADAWACVVHEERRPKWTVAHDEGKTRVQAAICHALLGPDPMDFSAWQEGRPSDGRSPPV